MPTQSLVTACRSSRKARDRVPCELMRSDGISRWMLVAVLVAAGAGAGAALAVGQASAMTAPTVVSLTTSGFTSFTVPSSVTSVTVDAVGGSGGSVVGLGEGGSYTRVITPGGRGGTASETVAVEPGELLDIMVAGNGGNDFTAGGGEGGQGGVGLGGSGGERSGGRGGGGGGESFVMGVGFTVVAGGGGGSGEPYGEPEAGSPGGSAESVGGSGGTDASPGCSLLGINEGGGGGGAGTAHAGGSAGSEAFVETSHFGPTAGVGYEGGRGGGGSEGGGANAGGEAAATTVGRRWRRRLNLTSTALGSWWQRRRGWRWELVRSRRLDRDHGSRHATLSDPDLHGDDEHNDQRGPLRRQPDRNRISS